MGENKVKDKHGKVIQEGDSVATKYRGGTRQGEVDKLIMDEHEAKKEGVANPPKVLFTDQHGHHVAHNPGTLEKK